jgi:uncharacterized membrane protein
MIMPPRLRKLMLTTHVTASVGWLGAVVVFLTLAIVGLTSDDEQLVRAVHLAGERITRLVILPMALASLVTGLVSSLGSTWGLFRHYWVIFKLVMNVAATMVLLLYTQTVAHFAAIAANPGAGLGELRAPTFVVHSGAAVLVLLGATVLAVYKPRGMTRYGRQKQRGLRTVRVP